MLTTCVQCNIQMQAEKNGVYVVKMFLNPPQPYQIWNADLHKCPQCGNEVVSGWGGKLAEHFQDGFDDLLKKIEGMGLAIYEYEKPQRASSELEYIKRFNWDRLNDDQIDELFIDLSRFVYENFDTVVFIDG